MLKRERRAAAGLAAAARLDWEADFRGGVGDGLGLFLPLPTFRRDACFRLPVRAPPITSVQVLAATDATTP
eukprot:CAMPEP_0182919322 /NCGR_PEP_ID=MMETSP0105_2-20130417/2637_1 /TAXON_ID=81532 ORGANISM="Acanthoeca-like sp., Strain 10tr" /NCGR_SAMPLE_ID=MMETSP0105_2 /ASSEMBLY_ACC=CAM_ASM_000205 /LENGTH=70 /DNA_ID=CAMNT_0025056487 /DNA_START=1 /DNA_END=210 /DNA_ORIENTATION=-